jgi:sortase A
MLPGGVQPNEEESLPFASTGAINGSHSAANPSPEQAVRIQIPAINVDAPVIQGEGWEQLKKGVGQHAGHTQPRRGR